MQRQTGLAIQVEMQYERITSKVSFPAPLHLDGASRSASFASLAKMRGLQVLCAHGCDATAPEASTLDHFQGLTATECLGWNHKRS